MKKICTKCKEEKPFEAFGKDKEGKNGLKSRCKSCMIEYSEEYNKKYPERGKIYRENNKEKIDKYIKEYTKKNKDKILKKSKEDYYKNKEKFQKHWAEYKKNNQEKVKSTRKNYYLKNRKEQIQKQVDYIRKRRKTDPLFKLEDNLRCRLYFALKGNPKNQSTFEYLGCSSNECKKHLESQFLPIFTWENHGIIWEIDHIQPCVSFDFSIEENIYKCFNYTNLRPVFKTTEIAQQYGYFDIIGNRNKSNKIIE